MDRWSGALACLLACAAFGCEPAVDVRNPSPFDEDDPAARPEEPAPPAHRPARAARRAPAPAASGEEAAGEPGEPGAQEPPLRERRTLKREALDDVLEAGLSAFLARVEVAPDLDLRQNFQGWEILRYDHGGSFLERGDIVTSINGHPLEKPSQVQALWEALGAAEAIVVRGRRDERPFVLRVEVVEASADTSAP